MKSPLLSVKEADKLEKEKKAREKEEIDSVIAEVEDLQV